MNDCGPSASATTGCSGSIPFSQASRSRRLIRVRTLSRPIALETSRIHIHWIRQNHNFINSICGKHPSQESATAFLASIHVRKVRSIILLDSAKLSIAACCRCTNITGSNTISNVVKGVQNFTEVPPGQSHLNWSPSPSSTQRNLAKLNDRE